MGTADINAHDGVPKPDNAEWILIREAKAALDAETNRGPCERHCSDHPTRIVVERSTLATSHAVLWAVMDMRAQIAMLADCVRQMQDTKKARLEWGRVLVPAISGTVGVVGGIIVAIWKG